MKALFGIKLPPSPMIFISCRSGSKESLTTVCPSLTIVFYLKSPCGISLSLFGAGSAIYLGYDEKKPSCHLRSVYLSSLSRGCGKSFTCPFLNQSAFYQYGWFLTSPTHPIDLELKR